MPLLHEYTDFNNKYPMSILARAEGLRAPNHVEIDSIIYGKNLVFPPGLWAGTTANPNRYRFLPRTKFKSVLGSVMTVSPNTAGVFVPGDVLVVISMTDGTAGAAVGTVASVDDNADTITFTAVPVAPAVNTVIGVASSRPLSTVGNRLGLISPNTIVDLRGRPNTQFGVFLGATVYRKMIPHWDTELERLYPEINYV